MVCSNKNISEIFLVELTAFWMHWWNERQYRKFSDVQVAIAVQNHTGVAGIVLCRDCCAGGACGGPI